MISVNGKLLSQREEAIVSMSTSIAILVGQDEKSLQTLGQVTANLLVNLCTDEENEHLARVLLSGKECAMILAEKKETSKGE